MHDDYLKELLPVKVAIFDKMETAPVYKKGSERPMNRPLGRELGSQPSGSGATGAYKPF